MILYGYDKNGFFTVEIDAQRNPMASFPDEPEFLIAANSTELAPPEATQGTVAQFNGKDWNLIPDPQIAIDAAKAVADQARADKKAAADIAKAAKDAANAITAESRTSALLKIQKACKLTDDEMNAL